MRKLILFLLMFASAKLSAQVYQEMPQYGYRANRMAFDSTLQIPTVCGVPTLKSIVKTNKSGAIAYDSCNSRFYTYNPKTQTWSAVSGGNATDTTSLSNRINQRFDSLRRSNDSVFARKNGSFIFQYKDSLGISGNGQQYYIPKFSNLTTLQNSQIFDSVNVGINTITPEYKLDVNGTGRINNIFFINGTYGGNRIFGGKLMEYQTNDSVKQHLFTNEVGSDSLAFGTFGGADAYVVKIKAYKPGQIGQTGTAILRLNGDEDVEKFTFLTNGDLIDKNLATGSGNADKMVTVDSLGKFKSQVLPSSSDTSKVVIAQVHNATGTTLLRGEVVYLFGANGSVASVKRANNKQDSTSSKTFGLVRNDIASGGTGFITTQGQIEKLNLGAFNEGDVLWLDSTDGKFTKVKPQAPLHAVFLGIVERANNGNGLAYVKPQNGVELDEVHDVQLNNVLNNEILVYSDTQKVWKNRNAYSVIDTTNRIATKSNVSLKLNISDTATMLSSYSTRINGKLNIADTSNLQSKSIPSYTFLANNTTATANAQALTFKDTSGTYTGTITWAGTAPTSGTFTYRWVRIGRMVNINISLVYANAGATNNQLVVTLPADAPTPTKPGGLTAASNMLYPALTQINATNQSTLTSSTMRAMLRSNSSNNGFEFFIQNAAVAAVNAFITCTYFTD